MMGGVALKERYAGGALHSGSAALEGKAVLYIRGIMELSEVSDQDSV